MAKWGEGDPRWIVEQRADATNVNNWHWTEKNATAWSKDKIRSLLTGLVIENDTYFCEIKEVTKIEGEASASNRKAKLFFFYEWEIKAEWKGKLKSQATSYNGTIEIPNLSEEHDAEDVDIDVHTTSDASDAYTIKEYVRGGGAAVIREQLAKYIRDLKQEFSQGMILPTKDGAAEVRTAENGIKSLLKSESQPKLCEGTATKSTSLGVKIHCKTLTDTQEFKCSASDLYKAFTDRNMVRAFTQNDAIVEPEKGGRFSLYCGNVTGDFVELEPGKKIAMRWRLKTWPDEHYSNVTLELNEKEDCTELRLTQTGVPSGEIDKTLDGWRDHYWRSIKQTFGYGALLF